MNTPSDVDSGSESLLPAYRVANLDRLDGTLAKTQSLLVGRLFEFDGDFYQLGVVRDEPELNERPVLLTCEIAGHVVGVMYCPDLDRGWLGEHQLTREQLDNPMIRDVYADFLVANVPSWIGNIRVNEMLRSAIQVTITLTPAQNPNLAPRKLGLTFESLEAVELLVQQIMPYGVLAEQQRLDHFEVALPLVAASVTLSAQELASLATNQVIRIT